MYVRGHFNARDLTPLDELVAPGLELLPGDLQRDLRAQFWESIAPTFGPADQRDWEVKLEASAWLAERVDELIASNLDFAFDPEAIETKARNYARVCFYCRTVAAMETFCEKRGIVAPEKTPNGTGRGRLLRARDPRFWRRQLDKLFGRRAENALRRAGLVRRGNQLYASNLAVSARRRKQGIINRWVAERIIVSDSGIQLNLWDVRARSQANLALRRAELMTRLRGFEEVAAAAGHVAEFITLTTPSEYHRMNAEGGANPRYAGHTVRDGQAWLNKQWARARAKLKRLSILVYGFRIAEPHHDGTPHWHMVLFTLAHHLDAVRSVLTGFWLSDGRDDPGAEKHRIKFKAINRDEGSAAGYLAKYVAKNIDGFEVGEDYECAPDDHLNGASDAQKTCERVATWASRHGIRQFQQIGGPAVSVWRELRRLRSTCSVVDIEAARVHADAGDWCAFIAALGGIEAGRAGNVGLWSEVTGEINGYDELRGPQIVGIRAADGEVKTRLSIWRIEKNPASFPLGPVTITVRADSGAGSPSGWSNPLETSMYGPH